MSKKTTILTDKLPIDIKGGENYTILQRNPNTLTHGIYKYPCKFIPEIPRWALAKYKITNGLVFDPFTGSGTTLLEAILSNNDAIGTEIDPIAKLITMVKVTDYSKSDLDLISLEYDKLIEFTNMVKSIDYINFIPDINNINHWFNQENIVILAKLKMGIEKIYYSKIKNFFYSVFLSIIKPVSRADNTSPKPYVSTKVIKIPPNAMKKFSEYYIKYFKMIREQSKINIINSAKFSDGDALFAKDIFRADIAITSPPYINAFDYPRTLRLENLWFGMMNEKQILDSKNNYVGTERFSIEDEEIKSKEILDFSKDLNLNFKKIRDIDKKRAYVVKKFFDDMLQNLKNVNRHLKLNSKYVLVIGNSNIRGQVIESWKIITEISRYAGFKYENQFSYNIINPYIRIPRNGKSERIKEDYVLILNKVEEIE